MEGEITEGEGIGEMESSTGNGGKYRLALTYRIR
jgi:hypothetical protein